MIFSLTNEASQIAVKQAQRFFATSPLAQDFRWAGVDEDSKIFIGEYRPNVARRLPNLIVQGFIGDSEEVAIGQTGDLLRDPDTGEVVGQSFVGFHKPRLDFIISAETDTDCQRIADMVFLMLVRDFRTSIPEKTNAMCKPAPPFARVSSRQAIPVTDRTMIYQITFSSTWLIEWSDELLWPDTLVTVQATVGFDA